MKSIENKLRKSFRCCLFSYKQSKSQGGIPEDLGRRFILQITDPLLPNLPNQPTVHMPFGQRLNTRQLSWRPLKQSFKQLDFVKPQNRKMNVERIVFPGPLCAPLAYDPSFKGLCMFLLVFQIRNLFSPVLFAFFSGSSTA